MKRTAAVGFVIVITSIAGVGGLAGCNKDAESSGAVHQSRATEQLLQPAAALIQESEAPRPSVVPSAESPTALGQPRVVDRLLQPVPPLTGEPEVLRPLMARPAGSPASVLQPKATDESLRPAFPLVMKSEALWPLVAQSEVIVAGTLDVPFDRFGRRLVFTL